MNPGDTPPADPLMVESCSILFIICCPELCSLEENIITYQAMLISFNFVWLYEYRLSILRSLFFSFFVCLYWRIQRITNL